MTTVHCKACGKNYNYEENGCCPSCGAYNRPPRRETVEADGTVHHLDDRAAPTGRMPGGGGKVCFEEKTCYEEQARGGRARRAPRKPQARGGQPLFAKLVMAVIIAIAVGMIVSVVRMIAASSVWEHTQSTPDYSWGEDWDGTDWDGTDWDDRDWSDWDEGNRGPDANQEPVWPSDTDDGNWPSEEDWQNFFDSGSWGWENT